MEEKNYLDIISNFKQFFSLLSSLPYTFSFFYYIVGINSFLFCFFQVIRLNETRQQLMVHWVGENSDVIICLAREGYSSSAIYISYDYGDTYVNKTEDFKIDDTKNLYASIDKFYIHPTFKSYVILYYFNRFIKNTILLTIFFFFLKCVYTDVLNRKIFTTIDHSRHIKSTKLSFVPTEVTYRPDIPFVFIVHDRVSPTRQVCLIDIKILLLILF